MGTVLSLANWIRDSGQWSATERGRLETLTEHLPGGGDLEVVYGVADDGAPWCAVVNEDGDVLVHVARLGGQFLVHVTGEEVVSRGDNLRDALGRWLTPGHEPERPGVVVPFARARSGMDMMILVAVATLLEEQLRHHVPHVMDGAAWHTSAPTSAETTDQARILAPAETETAGHEAGRDVADDHSKAPLVAALTPAQADADNPPVQVAHPAEIVAVAAPAQPAQTPQTAWHEAQDNIRVDGRVELVAQIRGGHGDDVLIGGSEAEHLIGGDGDDVLIGGGGHDLLDGGAGDDWIVLASEARAIGGTGADTFVISAPTVMDHADTLLGTILDFSAHEGDRLMTARGEVIVVPPWDQATEARGTAERGGQKVEVDLDGNGRVDGYVFISHPPDPATSDPVPDRPAPDHPKSADPGPSDPTPGDPHGFDPCTVASHADWSGWTDIIG